MPENQNKRWGQFILEECYRLGVRDICLAPGSRSTLLTLAAAEHPELQTHIHFDERALGFFALGLARITERPVALICTSGTAAANFYPAVIEAWQSQIPLLLLTADRPPELRGTAANQTIDQRNLYGNYCKKFIDLPCPDDYPIAEMLRDVDNALVSACQIPQGPVQLNCMFREPFLSANNADESDLDEELADWFDGDDAFTGPAGDILIDYSELKQELQQPERTLIIAGCLNKKQALVLLALAERCRIPVLADLQSQLGLLDHPQVIRHYDHMLLLNDRIFDKAEHILWVGGRLISKRLMAWLETTHIPITQISDNPQLRLQNKSPDAFVHYLDTRQALTFLSNCNLLCQDDWAADLKTSDEQLASRFSETLDNDLHECAIARYLSTNCRQTLFIGNSLPVRAMDNFACGRKDAPDLYASRGASGIDGQIATACGIAVKQAVTLMVGDLTALHDMNAFKLVAESKNPVIAIIVNNHGGGIFKLLPIAEQSADFERYFQTPHDLSFENLARMFKLHYYAPRDFDDFTKVYALAQTNGKSCIIDVHIDADATTTLLKSMADKLSN